MIKVKRIYEPREESDGYRVLVDRLWPRGVAKGAASWDGWAKELAPSPELRRWYGHDRKRFDEFRRRYLAELETAPIEVRALAGKLVARLGNVTLLTATKDVELSQAAVLRDYLESLKGCRP